MAATKGPQITVTRDGPYIVRGGIPLAKQHIVVNAEGESIEWREGEGYPSDGSYSLSTLKCGSSIHANKTHTLASSTANGGERSDNGTPSIR